MELSGLGSEIGPSASTLHDELATEARGRLVGVGAALATVGWWLANTYLHEAPASVNEFAAAERREAVEWRYAFDVHCNAFLPML